ncbi:hypothetical protein NCS52_01535400 [Fusarium sp. LHS14.1]|nr:hypothetical protein NCS52_01535400 [Fusarium sp. LHS14.1]
MPALRTLFTESPAAIDTMAQNYTPKVYGLVWAMDFADEYPSAEVIGTDLSPIQPKWTPLNCIFEIDDFEEEWLYTKPFDFIHARELEGCISDDDILFRRAFEHLKPGRYIEFQATYPR